MLVVSKVGRIVTLTNNKQKDAAECAPVRLELVPRPVVLPDGRVDQSLVLVDPGRTPGAVTGGPVLGVRCHDYLRALDQLSRTKPGPARRADIAQLMGGPPSTVDRAERRQLPQVWSSQNPARRGRTGSPRRGSSSSAARHHGVVTTWRPVSSSPPHPIGVGVVTR